MDWHKTELNVQARLQGLYEFTAQVQEKVHAWEVDEGICFLFIQHTSASLCISENADPTAKADMERFLDRLAPENQPWHQHTLEGPDDSPSHMRAIITQPSLSIPIDGGQLSLGTWQGIYLCEHRRAPHTRKILLRILKIA